MNDRNRVVITGLGAITALGSDVDALWTSMLAGRSGIKLLESPDLADLKSRNAAQIDTPSIETLAKSLQVSSGDRTADLALIASSKALQDAGLLNGNIPEKHLEIATIFGTAVGAAHNLYSSYMAYAEKKVRGMRPTTVPRCMANAITAQISMRFKLTGPNFVIVCACASSTTAIGTAFRMIKDGYSKIALAGGADAIFEPATYASWNNLGVMSKNADPSKACRPFDLNRDGCVLGEGSGALVLESLDSATRRNAKIYAEIVGFGESSDAGHITSPNSDGQLAAMKMALNSACLQPADIGFINAHGTATKANDECESRTIRSLLGNLADNVPVASNKSYFGHLLGASGAVETIVTALGLKHGSVPPNLNLDTPDPACNLNLVGKKPLEISAPIAMKNSFGFGGNNSVLILKKWSA